MDTLGSKTSQQTDTDTGYGGSAKYNDENKGWVEDKKSFELEAFLKIVSNGNGVSNKYIVTLD